MLLYLFDMKRMRTPFCYCGKFVDEVMGTGNLCSVFFSFVLPALTYSLLGSSFFSLVIYSLLIISTVN